MKKFLPLLLAALLVCLALMATAVIMATRPSPRPELSLAFLGYTNDPRFGAAARFGLTNLSAFDVAVRLPMIEVQDDWVPGHVREIVDDRSDDWSATIQPGEFCLLTRPAPKLAATWRLTVLAAADRGVFQQLGYETADILDDVGLHLAGHNHPATRISTAWVSMTNAAAVDGSQ